MVRVGIRRPDGSRSTGSGGLTGRPANHQIVPPIATAQAKMADCIQAGGSQQVREVTLAVKVAVRVWQQVVARAQWFGCVVLLGLVPLLVSAWGERNPGPDWAELLTRGDLLALAAALAGGIAYETCEWHTNSSVSKKTRKKYAHSVSALQTSAVIMAVLAVIASIPDSGSAHHDAPAAWEPYFSVAFLGVMVILAARSSALVRKR